MPLAAARADRLPTVADAVARIVAALRVVPGRAVGVPQ
jgi:hypothetical protein